MLLLNVDAVERVRLKIRSRPPPSSLALIKAASWIRAIVEIVPCLMLDEVANKRLQWQKGIKKLATTIAIAPKNSIKRPGRTPLLNTLTAKVLYSYIVVTIVVIMIPCRTTGHLMTERLVTQKDTYPLHDGIIHCLTG